jgi:hypothetical protein
MPTQRTDALSPHPLTPPSSILPSPHHRHPSLSSHHHHPPLSSHHPSLSPHYHRLPPFAGGGRRIALPCPRSRRHRLFLWQQRQGPVRCRHQRHPSAAARSRHSPRPPGRVRGTRLIGYLRRPCRHSPRHSHRLSHRRTIPSVRLSAAVVAAWHSAFPWHSAAACRAALCVGAARRLGGCPRAQVV